MQTYVSQDLRRLRTHCNLCCTRLRTAGQCTRLQTCCKPMSIPDCGLVGIYTTTDCRLQTNVPDCGLAVDLYRSVLDSRLQTYTPDCGLQTYTPDCGLQTNVTDCRLAVDLCRSVSDSRLQTYASDCRLAVDLCQYQYQTSDCRLIHQIAGTADQCTRL